MIHLWWVLILWCGLLSAKSYRLFEDPRKAPYALENWKIPSRISEKQWVQFMKLKGAAPYTIRLGDTLSKISDRELGSLDFWPKLWEVNKETILNPHLIEPEQVIFFIHPDSLQRSLASEAQTQKKKQGLDDLPDQLLREDFYNSHRLHFYIREGEKFVGVITGSYEDTDILSLNSEVYIGISDPSKVKTGTKFAAVREVSTENTPLLIGKEYGSNLFQLVGEVTITRVGEEFALAEVESTYEHLHRGDRLLPIPALEMKEQDTEPPRALTAKILLGENLNSSMISAGELVLVNKGAVDGIKPGFVFGVFEDTDPIFKKQDLVPPRSKGQVKIVQAGENWSTALIRAVKNPIETGDVLVAESLFNHTNGPVIKKRVPVFIE